MTDRIVDTLARGMAAGGSRRALLGALGVAGIAAVAPAAPEAEAKKKRCSGQCVNRKKPFIYVRGLHAAPLVGAVDLYVNGQAVATDVTFGQDTGLLPVPVGPVQLQVVPAGAPIGEAVIDETFNDLLACAAYEIAVGNEGLVTRGLVGGPETFPFFLATDKTASTATGYLSAIHLSPNAPAVDVWDVSGDMPTRVVSNLAYGEQSDVLVVPAGFYDLEVRVAGTDTVALTIPGLVVPGRESVQAHVIGLLGPDVPEGRELQALPLSAPATCNLKTVG